MYLYKFLFLFLFLFSFKTYALNIEESIKNTIENNPKVKIAIEKLIESKELIIFSKGYKLPSVTGSISGTYKNSDTKTLTAASTPETLTDSYKLTITQNLYDGNFNDLEIERSKILFDNEMINFKSKIQDIILDAIDGYLTVINYSKSLEANKKNYDSVLNAYEETKTRFDLGSATLYDVQNAEASFASAKTNLYEAEQNVIISKKTFERIVGLKPDELEDFFDIDISFEFEEIYQNALNNNFNLLLIKNQIKNKQLLLSKEKKTKQPSLDITGIASYSNGSRIEKGTETTSGSVGLTLTIPLFQKGQDNSNIRKYQSQILQSESELEDFKDDLQILLGNTLKNFKVSKSKMDSNLIIIQSIETSLKSLKEEYDIGTKTITDLVDEEEKLLNANVNFLNYKKEYLLNYFEIKSLEGSLINLFDKYLPVVN